jgi:uncharacterized protein YggE
MTSTTITIPVPGPRARLLAAGVAVGLLLAASAAPVLTPRGILAVDGTGTTPEHTISVSGTGQVFLSPDVADLRLGVMVTSKTVRDARAQAANLMTRVLASLKKVGLADKDIQTTALSLQPSYDYSTGANPPRLTGYTLTNAVAVTVRDLTKLGDAIDGAMGAGATTLDGVSFRVDDPTRAQAQARTAAMTEARAKADALATAAGVTISGVASIGETVVAVPYPIYYGAMAGAIAKDAATPVQTGTNEVSVSVAVVYVIR